MSSHPGNTVEMCCADFEQVFDRYVDGMLGDEETGAACRHLAICPACDLEVTRWQQTRILLSTAVADFATAVDVSSLRRDVEAALGFEPVAQSTVGEAGVVAAPRRAGDRAPSFDGAAAPRRSASRRAAREAAGSRVAGALRFLSAASVSAAVAAAAVFTLTAAPQNASVPGTAGLAASGSASPVAVASAPARPAAATAPTFRAASLRPRARGLQAGVAPAAADTPPPLAYPEPSHVDGLEAAPGHLVSTWVQPRTNARVIWIDSNSMGAPVRTAGLDR